VICLSIDSNMLSNRKSVNLGSNDNPTVQKDNIETYIS
jgi:hypothetical protein